MFRVLSVALFLVSTSTAAFSMCGDMDGSGSITVTDGVNVLRAAAGLPSQANCDGGTVPQPTTTPVQQPTAHATPIQTSPLAFLLGTWNFTFTLTSTFTDTYRFQQLSTSSAGKPIILGLNQFDRPFLAARIKDLTPSSTLPYVFELLDNQGTLCDFHVFNRNTDASVSGEVLFMLTDASGDCDPDTLFNVIKPMSGSKISSASAAAVDRGALARMADARAFALVIEAEEVAAPASGDIEAIRGHIRSLVQAAP